MQDDDSLIESLIADFGGDPGRIATYYQIFYNRLPAAAGLDFWTRVVRQNPDFSDMDLAREFFEAGEFEALYGDLSAADTVTALFRNVLGRDPAPAGLAFWQARVEDPDNGFGLLELGFQFATALETVLRVGPRAEAYLEDLARGVTPRPGLFDYPGGPEGKPAPDANFVGGGMKEQLADGVPAAAAHAGDGNAAASALIGLDSFRADPRLAGIDGSGVAVAVVDSGVDLDHPAFGPLVGGRSARIVEEIDFTAQSDGTADDSDGHGTLVASIIGSSDPSYPGVAPGVDIVALQGLGGLERALQWLVREAETYNIVAVNLSLGYDILPGIGYNEPITRAVPPDISPIADELAALQEAGIILVAAAGNSYDFWQSQGNDLVAADPHTISVGALWDERRALDFKGFAAEPGDLAYFSQRGTAAGTATLFAPGAEIEGAEPGGGVTANSGTSFAAPFVTGLAVLAQDLALDRLGRLLTPFEFETILRLSATPIEDREIARDQVVNTGAGFARVDAHAMAETILRLAPPAADPPETDAIPGDAGTGRTLAAGAEASDLIDFAGDRDWWRVTLEEGARYVIRLTGDGAQALADPFVALRDGDGRIVGSDDDGAGAGGSELRLAAPASGAFFVEARGVDGATGGYRLSLAIDEAEGDLPADATTDSVLVPGVPVAGVLEAEGDHDWHALAVEAGQRFEIRLAGAGATPLFDPVLTLLTAAGEVLGRNDDADGLDSVLVFTAAGTGTLYADAGGFDEAETGGYAIELTGLAPIADVGGDPASAAPLALDQTVQGGLDFIGDTDWFAVELVAGERYDFALAGLESGAGTLPDPYLELRDGAGTLIAADDDAGIGFDARIGHVPETSGVYHLVAGAFDPAELGTYALTAARGTLDRPDVPGGPETPESIFPNQIVDGVLEAPGDTDWYSTFLFEGESFVFSLIGLGGAGEALADPLLRLYDAAGAEVDANDDRAPGVLDSELRFTATEEGLYYLSAEAFAGEFAGQYRLTMIEADLA